MLVIEKGKALFVIKMNWINSENNIPMILVCEQVRSSELKTQVAKPGSRLGKSIDLKKGEFLKQQK